MPEHVMNYVETDALADLTLVDWRRNRMAAASRRRRRIRVPVPRLRPAFAF